MSRSHLLSLSLSLSLSLCLLTPPLFSQSYGQVFDNLSLRSELLDMDRHYAVYLPPGYETSQRSYPVLYLLHGAGDDQTGWVQFGEVLRITDAAIRDGSATPMVIVMPDADTGRRGYFNDIDGTWNYEDFFFEELLPHVEREYRIKGEKRYRAVAGLSMGGGGSFMYALHHPELFSSACPLSAYVGPLSLESARQQLARREQSFSAAQIEAHYRRHSALELIADAPADQLKAVRWFIDCGDDDFLYEGNSLVHIAMQKKEIPHEYRVRDGAHNWTYWRESLPAVLAFVSAAFHQY
jgi:enterochelin esterase-like enzyme